MLQTRNNWKYSFHLVGHNPWPIFSALILSISALFFVNSNKLTQLKFSFFIFTSYKVMKILKNNLTAILAAVSRERLYNLIQIVLNLNFLIIEDFNKSFSIISKNLNSFITDIQNDPIIVPVILTVASAAVIATAATVTWRYFYPTSTVNSTTIEVNATNSDVVTNTVNEVSNSAPAIITNEMSSLVINTAIEDQSVITSSSEATVTMDTIPDVLIPVETIINPKPIILNPYEQICDDYSRKWEELDSIMQSIPDLPFIKKLSNEIVHFIKGSEPNYQDMVDSIKEAIARKEIPEMGEKAIDSAIDNICDYRLIEKYQADILIAQRKIFEDWERSMNLPLEELPDLSPVSEMPDLVMDLSPMPNLELISEAELEAAVAVVQPSSIQEVGSQIATNGNPTGGGDPLSWWELLIKIYDGFIATFKVIWAFFFGG